MSDTRCSTKKSTPVTDTRCSHSSGAGLRRSPARTTGVRHLLLIIALAFAGCASPIEGLWPPSPGETSHRILVFSDQWHTSIGVWGADDPEGKDIGGYREWGYAHRGFYYEGDTGSCAVCCAIFIPSAAVVLVRSDGLDMPLTSPHPPVLRWEFRLTPQGHRALIAHLEAEKANPRPFSDLRGYEWYEASSSYHGFHHCHHWTMRALRAAGLPVYPIWSLFRGWTRAQLDRAARMQEELRAQSP